MNRNIKYLNNVLIMHPGHLHVAYQLALALQEAGLLKNFLVGFYSKSNPFVRRIISILLTKKANIKLATFFSRRYIIGLDPLNIKIYPLFEIIYVLCNKFKLLNKISNYVIVVRNEYIDIVTAIYIIINRPSIVIAYDTCAYYSLKAAKKIGSIAVLDQVIASREKYKEIKDKFLFSSENSSDSSNDKVFEWAMRRNKAEAMIADIILVPSTYVLDSFLEIGIDEAKFRICPYGSDVNIFLPKTNQRGDQFTVLFVGQLTKRKGVNYLLESINKISDPNINLILVGSFSDINLQIYAQSNIFKHITYVPYGKLTECYQSADIFVYPSLHEGSALAIYEAMSCGLPIVTTYNSGSIVRDGIDGYLVSPANAIELAEKIILLKNNFSLKKEMSKNARERAKEFSWLNYRKRIIQILEETSNIN